MVTHHRALASGERERFGPAEANPQAQLTDPDILVNYPVAALGRAGFTFRQFPGGLAVLAIPAVFAGSLERN